MPGIIDGPHSDQFQSRALRGNASWAALADQGLSDALLAGAPHAPRGKCIFRGLPVTIGARPVVVQKGQEPVTVKVDGLKTPWLIFAHCSDIRELERDEKDFVSPIHGPGHLAQPAADYVLVYADGSEARTTIRWRHQLGAVTRGWGVNCLEAVAHGKPRTKRGAHEQTAPGWGLSQTRTVNPDFLPFTLWLWDWANPHPNKAIAAIRFEPRYGSVLVAGLTTGKATSSPIRWRQRRKAVLTLPRGVEFDPTLDGYGELKHLKLDLGQVISATPRLAYPQAQWSGTYNNALPTLSKREILVEYTSHEDARFHLPDGKTVPVSRVETRDKCGPLRAIKPAHRTVTVRVVEKASGKPVAVKLHAHGESDEYLPPNVLHRVPNSSWFEDYSPEFQHGGLHKCVYIDGQTELRVPLGKVYVEVSKGFEIRPVRRVVKVTGKTREILIEVEKVLPWREAGWVSADTHVHFLSPQTGLLEGAAEGVNVVNLLASQWGELMTNVGDFDGRTVFGDKKSGGDGEHLLRVGTENRQHVLGHISLVGYNGPIIAPMTTGGPDESALGDPIEVLLTEWARQCKAQDGVVVIPHFPFPRLEHAATIVAGDADAIEMCSWGNLYGGINPYSLVDWYRYLNNGYLVAAVGGTDKMSADTAVGTVRSYARIARSRKFTYETWKDAIRRAETFVTFGPLMEFTVDGKSMGSRIKMSRRGGTVDVNWKIASVTVPMSKVELVANGEVIAGREVSAEADEGHFSVNVDKCTWLALLVRGHYADKPEIIAAHSSPVMIDVAGTEFYKAADSLTILNQIEGALAYLDTVGTRAENAARKRMKMVLTGVHREMHNRMHRLGRYHEHTVSEDHPEHHD